jgi:predicted metal-dependent HD superfamily phosphohydrolase
LDSPKAKSLFAHWIKAAGESDVSRLRLLSAGERTGSNGMRRKELTTRWHAFWQRMMPMVAGTGARPACAGQARAPDAEKLLDAWGEPGRAYHNRDHLSACFVMFDKYRHLADRPELVELALWYHDAVYDPRRANNEEASADWAARDLKRAGLQGDDVLRVRSMIMATRHLAQEGLDHDTQLLLDIDLSILAAPEPVFDTYELAIRQEYRHVPAQVFVTKRAEVLKRFTERERIFHLLTELEAPARENLARSVTKLAGGDTGSASRAGMESVTG